MVKSACKSNDTQGAQRALHHMRERGATPSSSVYTLMINTMRLAHKFESAFDILHQMRLGWSPTHSFIHSLS
jgi:pentatricopeptide repeat protein